MAINPPNDTDLLQRAIIAAVKRDTEVAFDQFRKELTEKLDRERDNIVAGVALNVMKHVQFETMNQNLVITVRKEIP